MQFSVVFLVQKAFSDFSCSPTVSDYIVCVCVCVCVCRNKLMEMQMNVRARCNNK